MTINSNNTSDINTALLYVQNKIKTLSGSQSDYASSNDTSLQELKTQVDSLIIPVGSQVICDSWAGIVSSTGRGAVLGQYNNALIDGIFTGLETPKGYHKVWRLTQQVYTRINSSVGVSLNDFIHTDQGNTCSVSTLRHVIGSQWFTENDIVYETTMSYSKPGINLYMEWIRKADQGNVYVYNVTIHGAYQKD